LIVSNAEEKRNGVNKGTAGFFVFSWWECLYSLRCGETVLSTG
jgi:hypothetical protein